MDLKLRLKLLRVTAGLSQIELAKKLDVSPNYISMVERGRREPSLRYLNSFAGAVKVPLPIVLWTPEAGAPDPAVGDLTARLQALMAEFARTLGLTG